MPEETLPNQNPTITPEAQSSTTSSVIKKKEPSGKSPALKFIMLGVLFVIGIALIGIAYYLGTQKSESNQITDTQATTPSPTTDPTANWKTYTSNAGSFSIKYPSNWIIDEKLGAVSGFDKIDIINFYSNQPNPDLKYGNYVCVTFQIGSKESYQLKDGEIIDNLDNDLKIYQAKDNYNSVNTRLIDDNQLSLIDLPNNKKLLTQLSYNCVGGNIENLKLTFSKQVQDSEYKQGLKILKSFKFTDASESNNTSNWKTYNSTCGMSIKYPGTWTADNSYMASDKDICVNIGNENFKTSTGDATSGFYLNVHKKKYDSSRFASLEDYVKDYEIEGIPFNYSPKSYGSYSGFEFDPPGRGDNRSFIFIKDGYIYEVNWIISTSTTYKDIVSQIISSIKFN